MAIELASAFVSLSGNTKPLASDVKRFFTDFDKQSTQAGKKAGASLADGVADSRSRMNAAVKSSLAGAERAGTDTGRDIGRRLATEVADSGDDAGRKFVSKFESAASKANPKIKVSGDSGGQEAGDNFVGGFTKSLGLLKGGVVATIGLGVGKVLVDNIYSGMRQLEGADLVQARLGVDPATMGRIGDAAAKAYTQNFGESIQSNMDTAAVALQSGLLSVGASDKDLQATIASLSTVSTILGEDIPAVARTATQAIRTGLVKDSAEAFDLIVKSQQNGLNVSGDLLDTINEYGTQFRKLGISGPEAMGLISQAVKNGARDTDVAADALKEFSIRAVDGSKTTIDAFTTLGFNADELTAKFAAGGESARGAFDQVLGAIRSIKDPVEQARVGVQLFGTQWEDLGAAGNRFDLSTAVDEFGKVAGASQNAADTMASNSMNEWETAKRNIVGKISEIQTALAGLNLGSTIPTAINDWLQDPVVTPGAPGVPATPATTPGPAVSGPTQRPGQSPLDVIAGGPYVPYDPSKILQIPGREAGGSISGSGPKGKDSVLMWGAPGEHVLTDDDVDALGGQGGVYAMRQALHQGGIPGFDKGGRVGFEDMLGGNRKSGTAPVVPYGDLFGLYQSADLPGNYRGRRLGSPMIGSDTKHSGFDDSMFGGQFSPDMKIDTSMVTSSKREGYNPDMWSLNYDDVKDMTRQSPAEAASYGFGPKRKQQAGSMKDPLWQWINSQKIPGYENGGAIGAIDAAFNASGQPYQYGTFDCSKYLSDIYAGMAGLPPGRYFTTDADFAAMGFKRGYKPGALNIGTNGGTGTGGHMAGTLPNGMNVENTSGKGSMYGPGAKGAQDFTGQWYYEGPAMVEGGAPGMAGGSNSIAAGANAVSGGTGNTGGAGPLGGDAGRTEGYIPAGAGFSGKTGGGVAGSLIGLGGEALKGVIDTAAQAAKMGMAAGTMGASAAAGPAAGMGIDMLAGIGKRGVDYGVDMANIGIGAVTEIFSPFGAPRWLSDVDPTSFMPQMGTMPAATTTGEQATAQQNALTAAANVNPAGHGQGGLPGPGMSPPADPVGAASSGVAAGAAAVQTTPPVDPLNPLNVFGFDQGGWLEPGMVGANFSKRPEPVFNSKQWDLMSEGTKYPAGRDAPLVGEMHVGDMNEAVRGLRRVERLEMMQHSGRPG